MCAGEQDGAVAVNAWLAAYAQKRQHPDPAQGRRMNDFELAPASQINAGQVSRAPCPASSGSCTVAGNHNVQMWKPSWLAAPESFVMPVFEDIQLAPQSMAEQLQKFRQKVDATFGWDGKVLDERQLACRAAVQSALLNFGRDIFLGKAHFLVCLAQPGSNS